MKKLITIFTFIIISFFLIISCSGEDNDNIHTSTPDYNVNSKFIGNWKINYVGLANDPDFTPPNNNGSFINFKSNNIVEFKDQNNKIFTGEVKQYGTDDLRLFKMDNNGVEITAKPSSKFPGQTEFKTIFSSNSSYYSSILIGVKQ